MANAQSYYGFRAFGGVDQKGFGGVKAYFIPASVNTAVGVGDVVVKTKGLNTAISEMGIPANVMPTCTVLAQAAGTTKVTGVVVGIMPINPFATLADNGAAGKDRVVFVMDDLNAEFKVRANAEKAVVVGQNADVVYAAPVMGMSQLSLAASATTATLPFRVVAVVTSPDNDPSADCAEYVVRLNNSSEAQGVAGLA